MTHKQKNLFYYSLQIPCKYSETTVQTADKIAKVLFFAISCCKRHAQTLLAGKIILFADLLIAECLESDRAKWEIYFYLWLLCLPVQVKRVAPTRHAIFHVPLGKMNHTPCGTMLPSILSAQHKHPDIRNLNGT